MRQRPPGRDVQIWADSRGRRVEAHGIDLGARLIRLAREAAGPHPERFIVADAWQFEPDREWSFVYALLDQSPEELWCRWIARLASWVEPRGRLILGSYGSRSRAIALEDVGAVLRRCGRSPAGEADGREPVVARFAWIEC
jgi:hypothetical protein